MKKRDVLADLSLEEIFHAFDFDFENGKVYWKNISKLLKGRVSVGAEAGCREKRHDCDSYYWMITLKGIHVKRSRLMFYAFHKRLPVGMVDHINRNRSDDRISNLREADDSQNVCNRVSPKRKNGLPRGVIFFAKKFRSQISFRYKTYRLGAFDTAEAASAAYEAKRKELLGEFA